MMIRISKRNKIVKASFRLASSKSLSNRALIIRALSSEFFPIYNLSGSDDTIILNNILNEVPESGSAKEFNIESSGTAMRFLTSYLSFVNGDWTLTGSPRMLQRPIGKLAEALINLGAKISYSGKEGYPPLKINGGKISGNEITIDGSVSSQFISALLMIAPVLPQGLNVTIKNDIVSHSYINMTLKMLEYFGINAEQANNKISITKQNYIPKEYLVEADWSSASYWYSIAALSEEAEIRIFGLRQESWQGDSIIAEIMEQLGVQTIFDQAGVTIVKSKNSEYLKNISLDFSACPDLAQTVIVTCAALGIKGTFRGLSTLRIKETDRIEALKTELKKIGSEFRESELGEFILNPGEARKSGELFFPSYGDHRMALALTPLTFISEAVVIEHPHVINKSYPAFWNDLIEAGFSVEEVNG